MFLSCIFIACFCATIVGLIMCVLMDTVLWVNIHAELCVKACVYKSMCALQCLRKHTHVKVFV